MLVHGLLLNRRVSVVGSFLFFTQFIRSHGLFFSAAISCIFSSKNVRFASLTVFLNADQSWGWPIRRYWAMFLAHSEFHHSLECLVMFGHFEYLNHRASVVMA